jgi:HK97 family phage major capsid protein
VSELSELREERANLTRRAQELNNRYPKSERMPQAEANELDAMLSRVEQIDARIVALNEHRDAVDAGLDADDRGGGERSSMRTGREFRAHYMRNGTPRKDQRFTMGDFMCGVAGVQPHQTLTRTMEAVRASLTEGTDTAGGFGVPGFLMPGFLEAMVPVSSVLSAGASIVPLDMGAKTYTQAAIDNIPTAAWRLENGNIAESDPTFRAVIATPKSLAFRFSVSRELLADAADLNTALTTVMAQSCAKEIDRVALRGSGTNPEPRGILNTVNVGSVPNGANGAALAGYSSFFAALQTILQTDAPMPNAAIMSPRSLMKLGGLLDTTNQPLQVPKMLQDLKMLATSLVPNNLTVGTSTDCSEIYIGDFTKVKLAMRERMSIQKLGDLFATTGQIGFVCHMRLDVMLDYPKAFAVVTGVRP